METVILLLVVLFAIIAFATEALSLDMVSMLVLGALLLFNLVNPKEAMSGFSNAATITVACMFVLSAGLTKTGAVEFLANSLSRMSISSEWALIAVLSVLIATMSAFINNTAVIAVFLPIAQRLSREYGFSPSKILIPISFAAILGGTCTLFGTSTNIIVYGILKDRGIADLGMFELSRMGIILTGIGILYMVTIGHRLLPYRVTTKGLTRKYKLHTYLTEIIVNKDSSALGTSVDNLNLSEKYNVTILGIFRNDQHIWVGLRNTLIEKNDILLVKGNIQDIMRVSSKFGFSTLPEQKAPDLEKGETSMVEAIVSPTSELIGKTIKESDFRQKYRAFVLAIKTHGKIVRNKISRVKLSIGDTLLIEGTPDDLDKLYDRHDFIMIKDVELPRFISGKAVYALIITVAVVVAAALKIFPIAIAALLGCIAMIISGCISMKDAYDNIDWMIIFLLAGIIPLGIAMEKSGTAILLAGAIKDSVGLMGPWAVLSCFYLLTALMTELMSNNATALLIAPVAITTAVSMGVDPKPFAIAVMFAASASFMTPIGYQTNTLVYGPGGYRFFDFTRVGAPLAIACWIMASIFIPVFWNF